MYQFNDNFISILIPCCSSSAAAAPVASAVVAAVAALHPDMHIITPPVMYDFC